MRSTVALAMLIACFALATPSCRKLDFFRRREPAPTASAGPRVGTPAPEIDGETFDGKRVKLSDYRGKVVVLSFWFAGCGPCRAMIPHERELVERYRDKPFAMLGIYGAADYDEAIRVMNEKNVTWPVVKTSNGPKQITEIYGVSRFPVTVVIDADGIIRAAELGCVSLDPIVARLVAEAERKRN
ncbi:MAG TPA: TlpA disulfide reductase family protein [Gemmataceae bacterium]|nr:TlpA disulfide reductase family protein [Gemmataceae bacterium]